jgi:putative ABC transport system permease protein
LLSKKYAEQNLLEVGSGIKLQYQNSNGETAEQMYRISGIFENSTPWHSSYIFVTYNTFNKMFGESKLSNNIKIMVDEESNIENVKGHLKEAIKRNTLPFVVSDYKEEATIYKGFSETARAMFNSMNFIVIFILFIGIQTIIILSLSDRKKEFVTLRVLGFYNKDITVLILFEYLIISLIALAIGILISLIVIGVIQQIGIPLKSDVLQYLFGNSYLYPVINSLDYIITVIMIFSFVIVSVLPQGLKKRKITSKSLN